MPGTGDSTRNSPVPATQDGSKQNDTDGEAVGKPDRSLHGLQNAVDELEGIAHALKADQRRSWFRVVDRNALLQIRYRTAGL